MIRFVLNMMSADKNNAKADRINIKAFEKIAVAEEQKKKQEYETKMAILKLANRKRGILSTSMNDFVRVYEKIIAINFQESDGIKELENLTLSPISLQEMKSMIDVAGIQMTTGEVVATYLIKGGISGIIAKDSEVNVSVASMRKRQADVVASQLENVCIALEDIKQRANMISQLIAKLNILLRKSIETTETIICEKGKNRNNYSKHDKEYIITCMNLASAIKKVIDTKLLDENGEIAEQSIEAIRIGEDYLQKIGQAVK